MEEEITSIMGYAAGLFTGLAAITSLRKILVSLKYFFVCVTACIIWNLYDYFPSFIVGLCVAIATTFFAPKCANSGHTDQINSEYRRSEDFIGRDKKSVTPDR